MLTRAGSNMASGYTRAYNKLDEELRKGLAAHNITQLQADGELLHLLCQEDNKLPMKWAAKIRNRMTQGDLEKATVCVAETAHNIEELALAASLSKQTTHYSELEVFEAIEGRKATADDTGAKTQVEEMLRKWRHYNPRKHGHLPEASQRHLESELRRKWLLRLITHFLPHAKTIPHMAEVMNTKDPMGEYLDLFGKTRWRTAKIYTLNIEKIL